MKRLQIGTAGVLASIMALSPFSPVLADKAIEVEMHKVTRDGTGESIGTVTLEEHRHGVLIKPELGDLEPGLHGFHIHENPDCGPATEDGEQTPGGAAGGHYSPDDAEGHRGPYDAEGHLGDLPALFVEQSGTATEQELAPRLQIQDIPGRALVIHEGGDNYSDEPKLGGGGARVACGVIAAD